MITARSAFSQTRPVYPSSSSLRINVCELQNVPGWPYFSCTVVPLYCFVCVCFFLLYICVLVLLDSHAVARPNKPLKILGGRVARAEWRAGRMKPANDCIQNGRCYTYANEWFITEMLRFDIDLCGDKVEICCLFLWPLLHDSRKIDYLFMGMMTVSQRCILKTHIPIATMKTTTIRSAEIFAAR